MEKAYSRDSRGAAPPQGSLIAGAESDPLGPASHAKPPLLCDALSGAAIAWPRRSRREGRSPVDRESALDQALSTLSPFGPTLRNGLSSHAPMVAEVLSRRHRPDAISAWIEAYRPQLCPWPAQVASIPTREGVAWRSCLGQSERVADWRVYIARDLEGDPLSTGVERWVARLAPGACADATHGLIRTAHAVAAAARRTTPERRGEVADAIAIWAASYRELPEGPRESARRLEPGVAIEEISRLPEASRRPLTTIVDALEDLRDFPPFGTILQLTALPRDADTAIDAMAEAFARVFVSNARDALTSIVFAHGVTSVVALRSLLPHLHPATTDLVVRYAWQAACALYVALGTHAPGARSTETCVASADGLFDRAVATGDDHAVKLVDACLREHAREHRAIFVRAAERALTLLGPA